MKYGETMNNGYTYRYAEVGEWHTNKYGQGLWCGERQVEGTAQFDVVGCSTLKTAKAKIRRYMESWGAKEE